MVGGRNLGLNVVCLVLSYSLVWGILYLYFAPDRSPLNLRASSSSFATAWRTHVASPLNGFFSRMYAIVVPLF